ncbi:hypothetical protein D3C76_1481050 [compost metagenome]
MRMVKAAALPLSAGVGEASLKSVFATVGRRTLMFVADSNSHPRVPTTDAPDIVRSATRSPA